MKRENEQTYMYKVADHDLILILRHLPAKKFLFRTISYTSPKINSTVHTTVIH